MFTRCLVCGTPFPAGTLVEHFPIGRRIAYDPERGRLWAICEACSGWTLAPIEERWEAVEELERLLRGSDGAGGRVVLAAQTDNIGLYLCGATKVVRVGRATVTEEASWRYGLSRTSARVGGRGPAPFSSRRLSMGEWLLGGAYAVRTAFSGATREARRTSVRRWVRYGRLAWRGTKECVACGYPLLELSYPESRLLILRDSEPDDMTPDLVRACPRCHDETSGGLHLSGSEADFVLRRVLAYHQDDGVPEARIRAAGELIEGGGGPRGLSSLLTRYGRYLGDLTSTSAVALRIVANEAREVRLLKLETVVLERQWRREEELAAIVDDELSASARFDQMRQSMRGL